MTNLCWMCVQVLQGTLSRHTDGQTHWLTGQCMFSFFPFDYINRALLILTRRNVKQREIDGEWFESRRGLSERQITDRQTDIRRERAFPVMHLFEYWHALKIVLITISTFPWRQWVYTIKAEAGLCENVHPLWTIRELTNVVYEETHTWAATVTNKGGLYDWSRFDSPNMLRRTRW